jgi:cell division protein FtsI (penicillin-binding protein 3)
MSQPIKSSILFRLQVVFLVVMVFAGAILWRSARLATSKGTAYRDMAEERFMRHQTIDAARGNIYAADGSLLAASLPYFRIAIDPTVAQADVFDAGIDSLALLLAGYSDKHTVQEYRRKLIQAREAGKQYVLLFSKVTYPEKNEMIKWPIFRKGRGYGGLIVEEYNKRQKPYGVLAHRTIGYVSNGLEVGLEGQYDDILTGREGKQRGRYLSNGVFLPLSNEYEIEPLNGKDVVSTLDIAIQDVAESALERALIRHDAAYGCAVVMEVQTGKIAAMANLTRQEDGTYFELFNYAVGEATEPGSTFKLASLLALAEDGHCNLDEMVDLENGQWSVMRRTMQDSEGRHDLREVTLARAFWRSSNVGISKVINRYYGNNPSAFLERIRQFNLHEKTQIALSGEAEPFIPMDPSDRKYWSGTTLPWLSIGYGLQLSPLQTLSFYNAVANDGRLMQPYLVSEIREQGKVIEHFEPRVIREHIAKPEAIAMVQQALTMVVDSGTARSLRSEHYTTAGKTGTSLVANATTSYKDQIYQASFAGYFPADKPRYSCIVVVNGPTRNGFYGADVAGPVFKAIADRVYASRLGGRDWLEASASERSLPMAKGYQPDLEAVLQVAGIAMLNAGASEWASMRPSTLGLDDQMELQSWEPSEEFIPDVRGLGLRDALFLLENKGWEVRYSGLGKVKAVRRGEDRTLWLTLG